MKDPRVKAAVIAALVTFLVLAASMVAAYFISGVQLIYSMNQQTETSVQPVGHPQSTTQSMNPVIDLEGVWTYTNEKGGVFEATVTDTNITILMKTKDISLSYWNGSFEAEQLPGSTVSSKADESKPFLSQSKIKEFVVGDETLSFDYSQGGLTKRIELKRG